MQAVPGGVDRVAAEQRAERERVAVRFAVARSAPAISRAASRAASVATGLAASSPAPRRRGRARSARSPANSSSGCDAAIAGSQTHDAGRARAACRRGRRAAWRCTQVISAPDSVVGIASVRAPRRVAARPRAPSRRRSRGRRRGRPGGRPRRLEQVARDLVHAPGRDEVHRLRGVGDAPASPLRALRRQQREARPAEQIDRLAPPGRGRSGSSARRRASRSSPYSGTLMLAYVFWHRPGDDADAAAYERGMLAFHAALAADAARRLPRLRRLRARRASRGSTATRTGTSSRTGRRSASSTPPRSTPPTASHDDVAHARGRRHRRRLPAQARRPRPRPRRRRTWSTRRSTAARSGSARWCSAPRRSTAPMHARRLAPRRSSAVSCRARVRPRVGANAARRARSMRASARRGVELARRACLELERTAGASARRRGSGTSP